MTTRLIERIVRLVRADAHGVVGALEDRVLLLEQHLREADLALSEKRVRIQALADSEARLVRSLEAEASEHARLDEDAELALRGGKEDLARFALRRLLASRRRADAIEEALGKVRAERESLAQGLASQEQALARLRERARLRRAEIETRAQCAPSEAGGVVGVSDEEVEIEMLRRRRAEGGSQ